MGFPWQTLAQFSQTIRGYFLSAIQGAIVSVWPNTFTVTGKVLALLRFELQQRLEWLYKQLFASTADLPALLRMGWELGLGGLVPATAATGWVEVACTPSVLIPAGLQYQRGDGATYSVRAATTPAGSTVNLPLQADSAGALGNADSGSTLTLVPSTAAPSGLGASGPVVAQTDGGGLEGGSDAETTDHYRLRVIARKQQPPQGGSDTDYELWAQEALSTVIPGSVFVDSYINDTRWVWVSFLVSDQPHGIPSDGEVAIVQAYLSDPVRRPRAARVTAVKPTAETLNFGYSGLVPNTADAQAAVTAELSAIFAENVRPATPSTPFTFYREWADAAIDRAPGVTAGTLTSPAGDTTYSAAPQMPVLGSTTFS
jgi:uncharacterized phage protein gp47/JayE